MTRQPSVWHVLKFLIMKWHFSYIIYRTSTAIKRKPHHSDSNPTCSSTGGAKRARTSSESSSGGYSSHLVKTMTKAASVSRYVTLCVRYVMLPVGSVQCSCLFICKGTAFRIKCVIWWDWWALTFLFWDSWSRQVRNLSYSKIVPWKCTQNVL